MTTLINASPTNGLVQTADGSGVLKVQSNGVTTNALAWVNFNGTGTVAIRSSYNVSSITDNGTGDYTVNFATALSDANYAVVAPCASVSAAALVQAYPFTIAGGSVTQSAPTVNGFRLATQTSAGTGHDPQYVNVAVFGN
jgi:hypothetical protein